MATLKFTRDELIPHLGRFLVKVKNGAPSECWPWTAAKDRDGYGRFKVMGRHVPAHRMAFVLTRTQDLGEIEVVMHTCDNPSCCNPAHLKAGTQVENIADRSAKGRNALGRTPNPVVRGSRPLA